MKLIEINKVHEDGRVEYQKAILLDNPDTDYEDVWHAMHAVDAHAEDCYSYWEGQYDEAEKKEGLEGLEEVHRMTEEIRQGLFPGRI